MSASKWKPYTEYRVIQHAGIDKIPNHWVSKRMRYVFRERGEVSEDGTEELLSVSKYTGVRIRSTTTDREARATSLVGYKKCEPNDIVSNIMLAWDSALGVAFDSGIVSSAYEVYVPQQEIDPHFLDLLLRTPEYRVAFTIVSKGIVPSRWRMYTESFNDMQMILPSLREQKQIGKFVHQIDENISNNIKNLTTQISLLEEKRSTLIKQAVTKGLNLDISMKDSGIEWLGLVPSHWNLKRMRFLCDITTGGGNTEDAVEEGDYPFFVRSPHVKRISTYSFDGEAVLTSGDGAGVGKIYHHYIGKLDFHQRVYLFSNFKGISGRLFYHYLKENLETVVLSLSAKSTVDSIRLPMLQNFTIAFGSKEEQLEILNQLERVNDLTSALVDKIRTYIQLLKEYRTALISAAITGKIDVRGQA